MQSLIGWCRIAIHDLNSHVMQTQFSDRRMPLHLLEFHIQDRYALMLLQDLLLHDPTYHLHRYVFQVE